MRPADNPFSVSRQHELKYQFPKGDNWNLFMARLEQKGWKGALVGKKGTGKTTLLLEIREKLLERGFGVKNLFLNCEKRKFNRDELKLITQSTSENDIILFDGSEQMAWWHWYYFLWKVRKAKGLILTTHKPSKLPTILNTSTHFECYKAMVQQLIEKHPDLQYLTTSERLHHLFEKYNGNMRLALRALYDQAMNH